MYRNKRINKIEVLDDNTIKMHLQHGKYCLLDKELYPLVGGCWWTVVNRGNTFYATNNHRYMHRVLFNPGSLYVDHINRNGLDNRKENIRLCNHRQNLMNRGPQSNCKSGYKGVSTHKCTGKWRANLVVNDKQLWLGDYKTPEEAALAYNKKAKEIFGEYAYQNKVVMPK